MSRQPRDPDASDRSLQVEARALGDPTRHAIFRYVADAHAPVGVAELSAHFGVNHNAVRAHLAKLTGAGLLVESHTPRTTPGRPALQYRLAPGADSRWGVVGPYERLSLMLAEMLRTGDSAEEVGRRAVPDGEAASAQGASDPLGTIVDAMERAGFAPTVHGRGTTREILLHTCPFATTATADPATVCALHVGIARGAADRTGGEVTVDELVVGDPTRADPECRLRVSLARAADA